MSTSKRLLLVLALAASLTLLAAGAAMAGGEVIPHGGYSTTTDACLQCHDIHEAGSDYVLLRWETVLDTCGSCHYLYSSSPDPSGGSFGQGTYEPGVPMPGQTPAYDPGYIALGQDVTRTVLPTSNSLGSRTSAYEVLDGSRTTHQGHRIQMGNAVSGSYLFADGETKRADYIPGGSSILTAIETAQYPTGFTTVRSFAGVNGLYCASCHTPHGNFGQELYLTGTSDTVNAKILSGKPNHTNPRLTISSWNDEGAKWCERCHDKRENDPASGHYNHPDTYCLVCHANSAGPGGNDDFPHTSENANLLSQEPDGLCISCHVRRFLP